MPIQKGSGLCVDLRFVSKKELPLHPIPVQSDAFSKIGMDLIGLLEETKMVLVGLRMLSKGNFLSESADIHGISKATAGRVFDDFLDAVIRNIGNVRDEVLRTKEGFFRKCRIPNIIGAVDGTLVPILAPKDNGVAFICRKGYHPINVMAVCDHEMRLEIFRFTDIVARWPGSQHDAAVFDDSTLKDHLETNQTGILLGDGGYPLRPYLLTPLLNPTTPQEIALNNVQIRGHAYIDQEERYNTHQPNVAKLLWHLHNFCIENNVPFPADMMMDYDNDNAQAACQIAQQNEQGQVFTLIARKKCHSSSVH
ncbi:LOW QUALITY PROTEIN: HARB1-like protein [Mya arenaria]|uniref:HARB1-like protein n=1 Tax=Mya arenaria TaxID=6604 RepID=A0ABY7FTP5_MYAAR|nr:LOW QUALITY PROTEIN: HARB1-like protein [Mya arenaria]